MKVLNNEHYITIDVTKFNPNHKFYTVSSGAFYLTINGDPQQVVVYAPINWKTKARKMNPPFRNNAKELVEFYKPNNDLKGYDLQVIYIENALIPIYVKDYSYSYH